MLQVRIEAQADFLAGAWVSNAQRSRQILEASDMEEGLHAAGATRDDRHEQDTPGRVAPESLTHGRFAQRVRWFERRIEAVDPGRCDTFTAATL